MSDIGYYYSNTDLIPVVDKCSKVQKVTTDIMKGFHLWKPDIEISSQ